MYQGRIQDVIGRLGVAVFAALAWGPLRRRAVGRCVIVPQLVPVDQKLIRRVGGVVGF